MIKRLFISFSGGETSAFMAQWLLANRADRYDEIACLFANTGQENEETLKFVQQCDEAFGLGVVWVEADIDPEQRDKGGFRIVDFDKASRSGEPFEQIIKAYGIPNPDWLHCTRELKTRPMTAYLRSIGWESGSYDTAIGIRPDEIDRIDPKATGKRFLYPLVTDVEMTKPRINRYWSEQSFRLQLKGYEGNCAACWKKSTRKLLTIMQEHPERFDFTDRMERLYGHIHPSGHGDRVFFREHMSTQDLRAIADGGGFAPAIDDAQIYEDQLDFGFDLDASSGCSESCEIDFSEAA
ncbi:MAG: phosphoadenosine phosphosulfate reductase family protein [Pseudomonadota bacterium]|nr:phosphoadenosine phosphosulfate reductase family protein [Pseudomonadota bacterium]